MIIVKYFRKNVFKNKLTRVKVLVCWHASCFIMLQDSMQSELFNRISIFICVSCLLKDSLVEMHFGIAFIYRNTMDSTHLQSYNFNA